MANYKINHYVSGAEYYMVHLLVAFVAVSGSSSQCITADLPVIRSK